MKAKFKELQNVIVAGEITGCGKLCGYIERIEFCPIFKTPYYHVYLFSMKLRRICAAERFIELDKPVFYNNRFSWQIE